MTAWVSTRCPPVATDHRLVLPAAAWVLAAAATLAAVVHPTWFTAGAAALAVLAAVRWVIRRPLGNLLSQWPVRLLPIHAAAVFAPTNPTLVIRHALIVAAVTVVASGRLPRLAAPDYAAAALAAWATAAHIGSDLPAEDWEATCYRAAAVLFIACRHTITDGRAARSVAVSLVAGCLYAATEVVTQPAPAGIDGWRPTLDNVNINYVAYALATGAVVAVVCTAPHARRVRATGWLVAAALTATTVRAGTRAALVALALAAVVLVAQRVTRRAGLRPTIAVAVVTMAAFASGAHTMVGFGWLEGLFERRTDDLSGRLVVWPYARQVWESSPWTGIGPGAFPASNPLGVGAHNLVLQVGVEIGVIGLAIYLATLAATLKAAAHANRSAVALLLAAWLPIWLSGYWGLSPVAWLTLALWSRLTVGSTYGGCEVDVTQEDLDSAAGEVGRLRRSHDAGRRAT